jgi:single-strand DNA-binding protein
MASLNKVLAIGNLGRDPETRYMPDGAAVTNFSVGCNWKSKDAEGVEWSVPLVVGGK